MFKMTSHGGRGKEWGSSQRFFGLTIYFVVYSLELNISTSSPISMLPATRRAKTKLSTPKWVDHHRAYAAKKGLPVACQNIRCFHSAYTVITLFQLIWPLESCPLLRFSKPKGPSEQLFREHSHRSAPSAKCRLLDWFQLSWFCQTYDIP